MCKQVKVYESCAHGKYITEYAGDCGITGARVGGGVVCEGGGGGGGGQRHDKCTIHAPEKNTF